MRKHILLFCLILFGTIIIPSNAEATFGHIEVYATINGVNWTGPVNYSIDGLQNVIGDHVESTHDPLADGGIYTLTYLSGGPAGATLDSIWPASSQFLSIGQRIVYTMNFVDTSIPPSGIVGHWKLNDSGLTACDSSGNGNHGTLENGPKWKNAQIDGGLKLDGENDDVTVPDAPSLKFGSGPFTLTAWVSLGELDGSIIFGKFGDTGNGWAVDVSPSGRLEIGSAGDGGYSNAGLFQLDTWAHIAIVADTNSITFYVNGVDQTAYAPGLILTTDNDLPLLFGTALRKQSCCQVWSEVTLDEVRLYNRALIPYEINNIYTNNNPPGEAVDACVATPPIDYNLSNSGTSNVIKTSNDAFTTNTITKTLISGTGSVNLTVSGLPSGVSLEGISSQGCALTCQSIITLKVTPSAPVGTFPITVTGSPLDKQTSFNLVISGDPLTVSCSASPTTALLGETVTLTANISGGTTPYIYSWGGTDIPTSPAPNTNPLNISYSTVGQKMISVTVTDSSSPPLQENCPVVTIRTNIDPQYQEF